MDRVQKRQPDPRVINKQSTIIEPSPRKYAGGDMISHWMCSCAMVIELLVHG